MCVSVGHYRGTGPLLVEKQVIVRKGDAYPIEQSAVARFKEGGHIEGKLYQEFFFFLWLTSSSVHS